MGVKMCGLVNQCVWPNRRNHRERETCKSVTSYTGSFNASQCDDTRYLVRKSDDDFYHDDDDAKFQH